MAAFIFPTRIIEQHHRKLRVSRFWRNLEPALINSLDQSGFMSFKWTWFNECDIVGIQVLAIKTSSGGRSSFRVALNRGVAPSWGAEYQHCRWFLEVKGPFRARPVSLWMQVENEWFAYVKFLVTFYMFGDIKECWRNASFKQQTTKPGRLKYCVFVVLTLY